MAGGKGFISRTYTASGSFTAPAGVTQMILIGCGGGQAGQSGYGSANFYASGGKSAVPTMKVVTVVPNTTYAVTVGAGGASTTGFNGAPGNAGVDTTFGLLATFVAPNSTSPLFDTGTGVQLSPGTVTLQRSTGWAGNGGVYGTAAAGGYRGGAGGGPGTTGTGSTGGNASTSSGAGSPGSAASSTNYGAGGAAGGSDPGGTVGGGNGGAGAGGFLTVIWVEG